MNPLFDLPRMSSAVAATIQSASLYDLAVPIRPTRRGVRVVRPSANFCERTDERTDEQGAQNVLYFEPLPSPPPPIQRVGREGGRRVTSRPLHTLCILPLAQLRCDLRMCTARPLRRSKKCPTFARKLENSKLIKRMCSTHTLCSETCTMWVCIIDVIHTCHCFMPHVRRASPSIAAAAVTFGWQQQ